VGKEKRSGKKWDTVDAATPKWGTGKERDISRGTSVMIIGELNGKVKFVSRASGGGGMFRDLPLRKHFGESQQKDENGQNTLKK